MDKEVLNESQNPDQHNFVPTEAGWHKFEGELILEDGRIQLSNCKFFKNYGEAKEYLEVEQK